jgi:hypothetical protein
MSNLFTLLFLFEMAALALTSFKRACISAPVNLKILKQGDFAF